MIETGLVSKDIGVSVGLSKVRSICNVCMNECMYVTKYRGCMDTHKTIVQVVIKCK